MCQTIINTERRGDKEIGKWREIGLVGDILGSFSSGLFVQAVQGSFEFNCL